MNGPTRYALIEAAHWEPLIGRVGLIEETEADVTVIRLEMDGEDRPLRLAVMYCRNMRYREITEAEALAVPRLLEAIAKQTSGRTLLGSQPVQLSFF